MQQVVEHSWNYYASCLLPVTFGYALLLCVQRAKGILDWKSAGWQLLSSLSVSYLAYFVHEDYKITMGLVIWLFLCSFSSSIIASALAKGITIYIKLIFAKYLADTKDDKQHQNP